jgi:phosphatidate phosphatase PAH1
MLTQTVDFLLTLIAFVAVTMVTGIVLIIGVAMYKKKEKLEAEKKEEIEMNETLKVMIEKLEAVHELGKDLKTKKEQEALIVKLYNDKKELLREQYALLVMIEYLLKKDQKEEKVEEPVKTEETAEGEKPKEWKKVVEVTEATPQNVSAMFEFIGSMCKVAMEDQKLGEGEKTEDEKGRIDKMAEDAVCKLMSTLGADAKVVSEPVGVDQNTEQKV